MDFCNFDLSKLPEAMRKIIGPILAILILSLIAVYTIIPSQIQIKGSSQVDQQITCLNRGFMQTNSWSKWIPKNIEFTISETFVTNVKTAIKQDNVNVPVLFSISNDESNNAYINFETDMDNSHWSPFVRIQYFIFAKRLQNKLDRILKAAGNYYSQTKNIYGFDVIETKVNDSSLLAIDQTLKDTPSTDQIYVMVNRLEQYIIAQNGKAKAAPMVNITRMGEGQVYTQVAIPLERDISVTGSFKIKKMVLGNLLSVEVIGDQSKINQAFEATKHYIYDKQKSSPAIPFVIYNTNRLLEKDPSRWISTINYPIF